MLIDIVEFYVATYNIGCGVCAEGGLHSMAPRSYLDHPNNVRHEHLCQYNRLAASCDVVHPDSSSSSSSVRLLGAGGTIILYQNVPCWGHQL